MSWWYALQHWLAYHTGSLNTPGAPPDYNFWSGVAGSFLVGLSVWLSGWYTRHTCHTWWCPRAGHYDFDDAATGLRFKLCRRCHPAHPGQRLNRRHIARIHDRNQGGDRDEAR